MASWSDRRPARVADRRPSWSVGMPLANCTLPAALVAGLCMVSVVLVAAVLIAAALIVGGS